MNTEGAAAFNETLRNKARKYPDRDDPRCDDHLLFPAVYPSFSLTKRSSVFTIGSCFARNVEESLLTHGISVPTAQFRAPHEEAPGRPNRILNQYNPGAMLQCVQAAGQPANTAGLYPAPGEEVTDCLLATGSRPVGAARAMERRQQINDLYSEGLEQADCVVVTLGLVEAWYDREHELYLNETPPRKELIRRHAPFEFRRLGISESYDLTARMVELLMADRKRDIVLTVSPVPLQVTFAGGDAVTANTYSKSVLRVVAEQIVTDFDNVDYFPSYEMVTTAGLRALGADNVHVRPVIVDRVVDYMMSEYLKD